MTHPVFPCLWFDGQAQAAADFYCTVFPHSAIISVNPLVVIFELNGRKFMGLNGGPEFSFNEAISFVIHCDTQEEIDHYWEKLTDGGAESRCGWLKDRYGVSWQVVPTVLTRLLGDPKTAAKATAAFMQMNKFDIEKLLEACQ